MIGTSTKTLYAVAALYELGSGPSEKLMKIREIAKEAHVPQNFLEQILLELRKNGILASVKGAHGGYRLAKPLSKIFLREIMEILESDAFNTPCKTGNPALKLFWEEMDEKVKKLFDVPLSELDAYQQRANDTLNYII
jgi:Rrf2 family protein